MEISRGGDGGKGRRIQGRLGEGEGRRQAFGGEDGRGMGGGCGDKERYHRHLVGRNRVFGRKCKSFRWWRRWWCGGLEG